MARDKTIFPRGAKRTADEERNGRYLRSRDPRTVMQLLVLPEGPFQGTRRRQAGARESIRFAQTDEFFVVAVEEIPSLEGGSEVEALMRSVARRIRDVREAEQESQPEVLMTVQTIEDPARLSDTIVANLPTSRGASRPPAAPRDGRCVEAPRTPARMMQEEIEDSTSREEDPVARHEQWRRRKTEYYLNEQMRPARRNWAAASARDSKTRPRDPRRPSNRR